MTSSTVMTIQLVVEVDNKHMKYMYEGDPRSWFRIVVDQIANCEDVDFKVLTAVLITDK